MEKYREEGWEIFYFQFYKWTPAWCSSGDAGFPDNYECERIAETAFVPSESFWKFLTHQGISGEIDWDI